MNFVKLRPFLDPSVMYAWVEDFKVLWRRDDWYALDLEDPSQTMERVKCFVEGCPGIADLKTYMFRYLGPAGSSTHTLRCGECGVCKAVWWHPQTVESVRWDTVDLERLAIAQERLRTPAEPEE
jgi:hypothetical protein